MKSGNDKRNKYILPFLITRDISFNKLCSSLLIRNKFVIIILQFSYTARWRLLIRILNKMIIFSKIEP